MVGMLLENKKESEAASDDGNEQTDNSSHLSQDKRLFQ